MLKVSVNYLNRLPTNFHMVGSQTSSKWKQNLHKRNLDAAGRTSIHPEPPACPKQGS